MTAKIAWPTALTLLLALVGSARAETTMDDSYFRNLVNTRYVEPFRQGNIDLWMQAFDENAIALHNRRPADRGRAAIEVFGRSVQEHFKLAEYDVAVTDIRRSGQWVYTVGNYTTRFVSKADGTEPFGTDRGKFVLLWELQNDNTWRIILDMGNSNEP